MTVKYDMVEEDHKNIPLVIVLTCCGDQFTGNQRKKKRKKERDIEGAFSIC